MKPHHLNARLWFAGALASVLLRAEHRLGWWLPLHMVLLGAASQLIAGGPLKFSTALAMAPEPALARLPRVTDRSEAWWKPD